MSSPEHKHRRRLNRQKSRSYVTVDEDTISEISWSSRPSTQETGFVSASRLSADSGAESIEDFHRRGSSPLPTTFLDYWDGVRRHTAPPRKTSIAQNLDCNRPNTVHAWDVYPSRSTMSRYTPLPSIGLRTEEEDDSSSPCKGPRRYCFQENLNESTEDCNNTSEPTAPENVNSDDCTVTDKESENDNMMFQKAKQCSVPKITRRLSSVNMESDADSDFDEDSDSSIVYASDEDEDNNTERRKPKKQIVRSATFTIEDKIRENSEQLLKLLLALRLPDGSRVSGYFSKQDTLRNVCVLAMQNLNQPIEHYELITTDVPRRVLSDFSLSLEAAGIRDKTLLNLQLCEDSDSG